MKKGVKTIGTAALCLLIALTVVSCSAPVPQAEGSKTIPVVIWHYYNGVQKQLFDQLIYTFNETVGQEKNIVVEAVNQGSIIELAQKTQDALARKVGARQAPDVFAAYADTVYQALMQNRVADIGIYLTDAEKTEYVDCYLEEGDLNGDGGLYIFPVAKSTEVLILNSTDWQPFAAATGARESDLATWEGIGRLAEAYYRWTDSQTKTPEDGKAFFGRDAMANYLLVGCAQLGKELFIVSDGRCCSMNEDLAVMRRLWDNYYVPYINGYFASFGRFRSDDVKTGDLIALVGSTASAAFFPSEVTLADGSTYPIGAKVYPAPNFEGAAPYVVQQGAGMAVVKSTPRTEQAAVTFLKWFTAREQYEVFSGASGYLPVKISSPDETVWKSVKADESHVVKDVLQVGQAMTQTYTLCSGKTFQGCGEARVILETSLQEKAASDRRLVMNRISEGYTREEAVALLNTTGNFYQWYASLIRQLELAAGIRAEESHPRFMVR